MQNEKRPKVGLIMTGGGARAAYQVGVLRALCELLPDDVRTPFPIICGTSAGAINAAVLAVDAGDFRRGVRRLMTVWKNFRVHHVYRADPWGAFSNSLRWVLTVATGGLLARQPVSLLDNSPLADLLAKHLDFDAIRRAIDAGQLTAFSITCSGYTSGQSVTFFQGAPGLEPWQRARRIGVPMPITVGHLLASSALPFIFPPKQLNREYFGDGSMRQIAPVSPALHLGADRLLVIGVGRQLQQKPDRVQADTHPSLAQIASELGLSTGHLSRSFSSIAGRPFREVLRRLRMEAACELLSTTGLKLSAIALARLSGAAQVLAIGAPPSRLAIARSMGADTVFDLDETTPEERLEWTNSTLLKGPVPEAVSALKCEPGGTIASVYAYDVDRRRWRRLPDLPTSRHGLGVASVGGRAYAIGGGTEPGLTVSDANEALTLRQDARRPRCPRRGGSALLRSPGTIARAAAAARAGASAAGCA